MFSLEPFETTTVGFGKYYWNDRLVAKDVSGNVVFDKRIAWDEVKKMERAGEPTIVELPPSCWPLPELSPSAGGRPWLQG